MHTVLNHDLEGIAADRFRSVAQRFRDLQKDKAEARHFDEVCRLELDWANQTTGLNGCREKYAASVRVLRDLAKLRWSIFEDGLGIELAAPPEAVSPLQTVSDYKSRVRQELRPIVAQQLRDKSVREFVKRMESPSKTSKRRPITDLIADGRELRTRLLKASETSGEERRSLVRDAVKPYLQLVDSDEVDQFTKIPLGEIWRYFRHTWSIPSTNIPGRNLFYLIRDAGHPSHAVMGITALSNVALTQRERDNTIGWTAEATIERFREVSISDGDVSANLAALLEELELNIECGINMIDHSRLLNEGEADNPTEAVIQRLRRRANEFARQRQEILSFGSEQPTVLQEMEEPDLGVPIVTDQVLQLEAKIFGDEKMNAARRAMVAKKRAAELARLLQARLTLRTFWTALTDPVSCLETVRRDDVTSAINNAWGAAKSARAGTNMLEITTCGAIRPYNHILAGKLAGLMMLSPQVASDYERRYGGAPSIISSMMKNGLVVKDTKLVFLGTTSLYSHGASQYNRLRLPAGIIAPDQPEIKFRAMGRTSAFGTVQFPDDTVEAINDIVTKLKGYREVNSAFGEGPSPKLRKMRAGLQVLGFDPSALMKHHQSRLIFGVEMFEDALKVLLTGKGQIPDYIANPSSHLDGSEKIARFWLERWLCSRLDHAPLLETLSKEAGWRLSLHIPAESEDPSPQIAASIETPFALTAQEEGGLKLWHALATAGHETCSDGLTEKEIERLHVPSEFETLLLDRVKEGFSIVLTGNAGDGKTHLLRRLQARMEECGAVVDWDATAIMRRGSTAPVLDRWRSAISEGRPYCVAANEYPLHRILKEGHGVLPPAIHAELARQCKERLAYGPQTESENAGEKLLVVDLSLRNPLAKEFVTAALGKMLSDPAVKALRASDRDPTFSQNFDKLSNPRVAARFSDLFTRLAERGYRATIRELWIVLAKTLFGDFRSTQPVVDGAARSWYSERLFNSSSQDQRFRLVELLHALADPAASSHPRIDWQLEDASTGSDPNWLDGIQPPLELHHRDPKIELERFRAIKRRFYFEHRDGDQVFALTDDGEVAFKEVLEQATRPDDVLKGSIIKALNFAYCPRAFSGSDRDLHLWVGHRFHEQPTRCYVANRSLPASRFSVHLPRLPLRFTGAFPYQADHFILEYREDSKVFSLKVDSSLYSTLVKLGSGFPRHLAPESDLNKVDDFLARLQTAEVPPTRLFVIFSGASRLASRVTLSDDFSQYTNVENL